MINQEKWFGKECEFQCCQWEENERTGGPNYQEAHPTLIYRRHEDNPEGSEGNCRLKICPIKKDHGK